MISIHRPEAEHLGVRNLKGTFDFKTLSTEERTRYLKALGEKQRLKGKLVERHFLEAWTDKSKYPAGLASVRQATRYEDVRETTDMVMHLTNGNIIRIQVTCIPKERIGRGFIWHFERKVVLVQMSLQDSHEQVRRLTLLAILRYNEEFLRRSQHP